ncbi:MAG: GNAT family N-acetyltransferase [Saprospiraceae bacterium]
MVSELFCCPLDFGSPEMDEALYLRDKELRQPLKLEFEVIDIEKEWDSYHIGAYHKDGILLGILILKPVDHLKIKMRQVAIHNEAQNKGIGSILVTYSEHFARSKGFKIMELSARLKAVPFYQKLGYSKMGKLFQEVGIDHYYMHKKIV